MDYSILFTMELEQNRSLPFMDVRFTRLPSGALEREVYRKPTHTNRYIHADSHQPMNVKSATIRCLVDRAFKVCSSNTIRERELETIRTIMVENGYKRKFVNKVIRRQIRRSERSRTTTDENKGKTSVPTAFHRRTEPGGKKNCERGEHTMHVYCSKHSAETA